MCLELREIAGRGWKNFVVYLRRIFRIAIRARRCCVHGKHKSAFAVLRRAGDSSSCILSCTEVDPYRHPSRFPTWSPIDIHRHRDCRRRCKSMYPRRPPPYAWLCNWGRLLWINKKKRRESENWWLKFIHQSRKTLKLIISLTLHPSRLCHRLLHLQYTIFFSLSSSNFLSIYLFSQSLSHSMRLPFI